MPGCGTTKMPIADYIQCQKLVCFDFLIVIVGRSLMAADKALAVEAAKHRVPVYFVRSQSDSCISNIVDDKGVSRKEARWELRKIVTQQQREELEASGLQHVRLFVVSARTLLKMFRPGQDGVGREEAVEDDVMDESELMSNVLTLAYQRRQRSAAGVGPKAKG